MGVSRRGAVPPMPEQLADQGQVLARHDSVARRGVPQVMQAKPAEICIVTDCAPAAPQGPVAFSMGVARKQQCLGDALSGQCRDQRPCGFAERHRARQSSNRLSWHTWRHTLGNLTCTAFNSEMGNCSFREKRDAKRGFRNSPLRLNEDLRQAERWDEPAIRARAARLADLAVEIWRRPVLTGRVLAPAACRARSTGSPITRCPLPPSTTPEPSTQV